MWSEEVFPVYSIKIDKYMWLMHMMYKFSDNHADSSGVW